MSAPVKVLRRRGTTRLSSKNQVTLPLAALRAARLGPGDVLRAEVVADGVIRLVREVDPVEGLVGSLPGLSAAADLRGLRDEWTA